MHVMWYSGEESSCQNRKQVRSLGREDPLEHKVETHSSILAWKSHGQRSLVGYHPRGCKELDTIERLNKSLMESLRF